MQALQLMAPLLNVALNQVILTQYPTGPDTMTVDAYFAKQLNKTK
jgi:hypothetical protein